MHKKQHSLELQNLLAANLVERGFGKPMAGYFARIVCDYPAGISEADLRFVLILSECLGDAQAEIHNRQVLDQVFSNLPAVSLTTNQEENCYAWEV